MQVGVTQVSDQHEAWLDQVNWTAEGLVPVIAQEANSGRVLMFAWMNREALERTAATREAIYWSRSRDQYWRKGEQSGHIQKVKEIRLDCDHDTVLLSVEQVGGIACHTGRQSCFFKRLSRDRGGPKLSRCCERRKISTANDRQLFVATAGTSSGESQGRRSAHLVRG